MTKRNAKKARKPVAKNYLVFTSSCGKAEQAQFVGDAATAAAAEKIAEKAMTPNSYGEHPKAVFITKIEKTGRSSSDLIWS